MKKIKFCLVACVLSFMLCGCGMEGDGLVTDLPRETHAPVESPYITSTPRPTDRPMGMDNTDGSNTDETPAPEEDMSNDARR